MGTVRCGLRVRISESPCFTDYLQYTGKYACKIEGGVTVPNIKSAKKRVKVNATKAMANKSRKSNLKTVLKKAELAVSENSADKEQAVRFAIKRVDQACAKGLMHKNKAARKKSQLAKMLNGAK